MPILKTKYSETIVSHDDEIVLVIPSQHSKPCIMKKPAPTGAIKVLYWDLITDKQRTKQLPSLQEAETFRTGVTWTREQTLKTVTVSEILKKQFYYEYYHRLAPQAVTYAEQDVPLDPQWLGIWLGDGASSACKITTADKEILEYITTIADTYGMQVKQQTYLIDYVITNGNAARMGGSPIIPLEDIQNAMALIDSDDKISWRALSTKCGMSIPTLTKYRTIYLEGGLDEYYRLRVKNPIIKALKSLGVFNNKHIPEVYLKNTRDIRLKVLAGLIDTDGYLHNGGYDFCFANKTLLEDIIQLSISLGFKCRNIQSVMKTCTNAPGGPKQCQAYRSYISGGDDLEDIPVLLDRKKITKKKKQRYDQEHFKILPDIV
jgi:hypothetical protein